MLDRRESIKTEIEELLDAGHKILKQVKDIHIQSREGKKGLDFAVLQALSSEYQILYTKALAIVRQLMPDRFGEFEELYMKKGQVKELTPRSYTISDFLLGLSLTIGPMSSKDEATSNALLAVIVKLNQQVQILKSAYSRIDSVLSDITGVLRAELFDSEIGKSRELLKAGYLRAAGTIASVVLESHLSKVCENHNISFGRPILHISDYNDALKKDNVYDIPTWRRIQNYNDIRIMCCHAKQREPTQDEVKELIDGVEKAIKTIF